jgi:hypothetical protein
MPDPPVKGGAELAESRNDVLKPPQPASGALIWPPIVPVRPVLLSRGSRLQGDPGVRDDPVMDVSEIQAAFDEVFDQAIVFHGFADYTRDYDVFVYATADPRTGILPEHLRYRFKHCVRASSTSALSPELWAASLDDRLVDYEQGCKSRRLPSRLR